MAASRSEVRARRGLRAPLAAGGGFVAAAGFVAAVPPHGQPFYPACPLHRFTGLWCPLCGSTRAVHAMLTGDVRAALHDNALLFLAAPVLAYLWVSWLLVAAG